MLRSGDTLGGFRIDDVIGVGGMAVVYRAEQVSLGRPVALKVLADRLAGESAFRERFRREGAHAAALDHPNIVPVYDFGEADRHLYLAMRLVEGTSLAELVHRRGVSPNETIELLEPIASALDTAHARGLIHRDVKPQNILVGSNGHPYLADFGIAKGLNTQSLTATGGFVGSVNFASPEQIHGLPLSPQSDIYSLTGVLFYCLTGRVPYRRETEAGVMQAHLQAPPPIVDNLGDHAASLSAVMSQGMAKEPGERYPRAVAMTAAAAAAVLSLPQSYRHDRPRRTDIADAAAAGRYTTTYASDAPSSQHSDTSAQSDDFTGNRPPPPRTPPDSMAPPPDEPVPPDRTNDNHDPPPARDFASMSIPLNPTFEFTHGPLPPNNAIPLLGRASLLDLLVSKLEHSQGGTFLIAGMRGVGKTTLVEQAAAELAREDTGTRTLVVKVNAARPREPIQLLYELIRQIYAQLSDLGALDRLSPSTRQHLETAYARTSQSITSTETSAHERERGLRVGSNFASLSGAGRSTSTGSVQAAYLSYGESEVEYDFMRLAQLMRSEHGARQLGGAKLRFRARRSRTFWHGRLVVIIDELDKATETPAGAEWLRDLVTRMKNVLTASHVNFVFVGGQDLYNEAVVEQRRGNSVYDSVFASHLYVPCIWRSEPVLLAALVADGHAFDTPQMMWLRDALAYRGRGIPRLLLKDLGGLVRWNESGPHLALTSAVLERLASYSDLQMIVLRFLREHRRQSGSYLDRDRWYLSVYYTVDLILRFAVPFTLNDVISARSHSVAADFHVLADKDLLALLAILGSGGFVDQALNGATPKQEKYTVTHPWTHDDFTAIADEPLAP
jgi:serine/threonine protein kinase